MEGPRLMSPAGAVPCPGILALSTRTGGRGLRVPGLGGKHRGHGLRHLVGPKGLGTESGTFLGELMLTPKAWQAGSGHPSL